MKFLLMFFTVLLFVSTGFSQIISGGNPEDEEKWFKPFPVLKDGCLFAEIACNDNYDISQEVLTKRDFAKFLTYSEEFNFFIFSRILQKEWSLVNAPFHQNCLGQDLYAQSPDDLIFCQSKTKVQISRAYWHISGRPATVELIIRNVLIEYAHQNGIARLRVERAIDKIMTDLPRTRTISKEACDELEIRGFPRLCN